MILKREKCKFIQSLVFEDVAWMCKKFYMCTYMLLDTKSDVKYFKFNDIFSMMMNLS